MQLQPKPETPIYLYKSERGELIQQAEKSALREPDMTVYTQHEADAHIKQCSSFRGFERNEP